MAMKQQRTFDIAEYADKVRAALNRLAKEQKPGQQSGTGSKTEVLQAAKSEIVEMMEKGYTAKQIADAMKADVFNILPKTITELTGSQAARKPRTKKATDTKPVKVKTVAGAPAAGSKATFQIKPDTEDL